MNNNLLTERALRDVFEITSYITVGNEDLPNEYGYKAPVRSAHTGKQMHTTPGKLGKTVDVYFQKDHPWVSDGDPFIDRQLYKDIQPEKYKGFLTSDYTKYDEFSNTMRTKQYREQLEMDYKHSKKNLEAVAKHMAELEKTISAEPEKRTRFEGPKYLYDIGKPGLSITPMCNKCHHEMYYCPHRAAHGMHNRTIEKEKGDYRAASDEIGRTAKTYNYAKPHFAHKPIIKDTFYRRQNTFYPAKTRTNFVNQANPV